MKSDNFIYIPPTINTSIPGMPSPYDKKPDPSVLRFGGAAKIKLARRKYRNE